MGLVRSGRVPLFAILLMAFGCSSVSEVGPSDQAAARDLNPTADSNDTSGSIQVAGGPCLGDRSESTADFGVTIRTSQTEIEASFGYAEVAYCPGHPQHGERNLNADGFFANLDSTKLDVKPGDVLTVEAPTYPGATLNTRWSGDETRNGESAVVTLVSAGTWEIQVPTTVGLHRLDLLLKWFEGEAAHAVLINTSGAESGTTQ